MSNRLLKESIKRSPEIDSLTWFEEVVFYRLIVTVDDYGCADGRIVVLKHDLFPTKESITNKALEDAISRLAECGLVKRYKAGGLPYIQVVTWKRHQRVRNSRHKYPEPESATDGGDFPEKENFSPQLAASCGELRPESESESESESEAEAECARTREESAAVFTEFENCGYQLTGHAAEVLGGMIDDYSARWVREAIRRSDDRGKRSLGYIRGILEDWARKGAMDDDRSTGDGGAAEAYAFGDGEVF